MNKVKLKRIPGSAAEEAQVVEALAFRNAELTIALARLIKFCDRHNFRGNSDEHDIEFAKDVLSKEGVK